MQNSTTPLTPLLAVGIFVSVVGIAYTLLSKNAQVKRIVFPLAVVTSNVVAFLIFRATGALTQFSPVLVGVFLGANALYTMRVVRFCEHCGRTIAQPVFSQNAVICPACRAANVA